MPRGPILVSLLLCTAQAWAGISLVQYGSAAATSATITATATGDLIIECGNRANNTAPSVPSGYTSISSGGANTQSALCAWKISPGAETTTGTMTNAANVAYAVIRGYGLQGSGPIGCAPAVSNGSSTSLTYPTCSLTHTDGSSYLFAFGTATGATTTAPDQAPTGMTLISSTAQSTLALSYLANATSGTVGSATIAPSTGHTGISFEVLGPAAVSGLSANLVANVVTGVSGQACTSTCVVTIPVPTSLTNNFLNVSFKWSYSGTAPTITNVYCNSDTGHATWTWTDFGKDVADTSDKSGGADYYVAGAVAGCTSVSATFSQPLSIWTGNYVELRGMATSSAIDATAGQAASGLPNVSPGSLTTTAGDVVYVTCAPVTNGLGTYGTKTISGGTGVTVLEASLTFSSGSEAFVQTNSGTISPTMSFQGNSSSSRAVCMALAIKASPGAGTASSGPHILQHALVVAEASTASFQFAPINPGDTLIFAGLSSQAAAKQWTSISDTLGSSFTTYNAANDPEWAIDCNAGSGADTITISGVASGFGGYVIQEISGLNNSSHTSCIDTKAGFAVAAGNGMPYATAPSITPSTASGLIEAFIQFGIGPATAAPTPAGAVFAFPTYTGITDASTMTEGGGFAYLANTSTSAKSFTWTNANSSSWNASAVAFLPAPGSSVVRHRAAVTGW